LTTIDSKSNRWCRIYGSVGFSKGKYVTVIFNEENFRKMKKILRCRKNIWREVQEEALPS